MSRRLITLLIALIAVGACEQQERVFPEEKGRVFPAHFSFENDYLLQVSQLKFSGNEVPLIREPQRGINFACGEHEAFRVCLNPDVHEIVLEISNSSKESLLIRWSDARIIDDGGVVRRVDTKLVNAPLPATLEFPDRMTTVPPRWSSADALWAEGKIYYASVNRENAYVMYEPLVPGKLTGSRDRDKAALETIAQRPFAMKLTFALVIGGDLVEVEAAFKLVDREEAVSRYRALLSEPDRADTQTSTVPSIRSAGSSKTNWKLSTP